MDVNVASLTRHAGRQVALPVFVFAINLALYAAFLYQTAALAEPGLKLLAGVCAGLTVTTLAIIGHDAVHQSYTKLRRLNRLIGTLAFLPALHPYSLWEYGHNMVHHRFTAQIGVDYGYSPMTVKQWRSASPAARLYYRFMRSLWGQPFYYAIDIWLPKIIFPVSKHVGPFRPIYWLDLFITYAFLAVLLLGLGALNRAAGGPTPPDWGTAIADGALYGFLVPFIVWNLFISFVTIVQHTSPMGRWSLPTGRHSTVEQQLRGTIHVVFPDVLDWLFHRVMQHQAHHLHPGIPLYALKAAQAEVAGQAPQGPVVVPWTPAYHWRLTTQCKLYDTDADRWCDFEGRPTTH